MKKGVLPDEIWPWRWPTSCRWRRPRRYRPWWSSLKARGLAKHESRNIRILFCEFTVKPVYNNHPLDPKSIGSCQLVIAVQRSFMLWKFKMGPQGGDYYRHVVVIWRFDCSLILTSSVPKKKSHCRKKLFAQLLSIFMTKCIVIELIMDLFSIFHIFFSFCQNLLDFE